MDENGELGGMGKVVRFLGSFGRWDGMGKEIRKGDTLSHWPIVSKAKTQQGTCQDKPRTHKPGMGVG